MIDLHIQESFGAFGIDIAFKAPAGVTAVFGRSGAGKTTLIRAIAGLERPDAGHVRIGGKLLYDENTDVPVHRRKLGVVFQDGRLFPHMTVARNLAYGGSHDREDVIDLLGLSPLLDRMPRNLSGGEKQRVALGRALMSNPDMLLLDEPLAALDDQHRSEIISHLEKLRDQIKIPMIYVSHDLAEIARLANTLVVIESGRVVQNGPLSEILSSPSSMQLFGVRQAGAVVDAVIQAHDVADGLTVVSFNGGQLTLPLLGGQVGQNLRVRVPAQDVILAKVRPSEISARNVIAVTITDIKEGRGPGVAVGLLAGKTPLLARITKASLRELGLGKGDQIFAILKATAIAPRDAGG